MANKTLQNPTYESNKGYTGFPMQHSVKFSSPVGYLLPVMCDLLIPGDKVRVNSFIRTRTEPLNTSAMAHITETIRYFFVPIEQLDHSFGSFFYGIQDYGSDFFFNDTFTSGSPTGAHDDFFPYISLRTLAKMLVYWQKEDTGNNHSVLPNGERDGSTFQKLCRLLDGFGVPVRRIFELLEFKNLPWPSEITNIDYSDIPALPLCAYYPAAYQKIYSDYFRLSDREANDARSYNLDRFFADPLDGYAGNQSVETEKAVATLYRGLFKLRRIAWNKDYFMSGVPSPVMGTTGVGAIEGSQVGKVEQWLSGLDLVSCVSPAEGGQGFSIPDTNFPTTISLYDGSDSSVSYSQLNPANLRQLFATEKLLEVTRRAGKHYDKQTLAHYGIEVPVGQSGECYEIGRDDSDIVIGDVVSTASTEQAVLGEIGGKGYNMSQGQQHEFTAKTHGVIMAVYYATPLVDYSQVGMPKYLQVSAPIDIPIPEYDNLGQQPTFYHESKLLPATSTSVDNNAISNWNWRWSEFKMRVNRVIGGFMTSTFKDWTFQRDESITNVIGSYLVDPEITNSIFVYNFTETPLTETTTPKIAYNRVFEADPLFHELVFDYSKASKMSRYGLPSL